MRRSQTGITLLGAIILALLVGGWIYIGIRVTPVYLNYMKVAGTLDKVKDEFQGNQSNSDYAIRKAIERHFNIESVDMPTSKDMIIKKEGDKFLVTAEYEDVAPLVSNVSMLFEFRRTVEVPAN